MRILASFLLLNALAGAQNLTEFGAVAAGSTVGGASGKPVSESITSIFGKVGQQAKAPVKASVKETEKDAEKETGKNVKRETGSQTEAMVVAPPSRTADLSGVPPPPSPAVKHSVSAHVAAPEYVPPQEIASIGSWADVAPVLPPPPVMSPEEFRGVSTGMTRSDVLQYGAPASKITMFEDGHVIEIFSYYQNGQKFGSLHLTDGVVSNVQ